MSEDLPELSDRQRDLVDLLPATTSAIATTLDIKPTTVESYRNAIKDKGYPLQYDRPSNRWYLDGEHEPDTDDADAESDDGPSESDLSERERYIVRQLQTGASKDALAEDLGVIPPVVDTYLNELDTKGWRVYHDEEADLNEP